jgi:hypothetical protein
VWSVAVKRKYEEEVVETYGDDSEDEYDDADDFIDDGPTVEQKAAGGGYSKYIREIFGYDKRK